jgi:hypothetical protein
VVSASLILAARDMVGLMSNTLYSKGVSANGVYEQKESPFVQTRMDKLLLFGLFSVM